MEQRPRSGRPQKLEQKLQKKLVWRTSTHPTATLADIKDDAKSSGIKVYKSTKSRTLHRKGLQGRVT